MRDESKEIPELGDGQESISIALRRLELRLNEAQQLTLADLAFLA
jgi:hypothetical protein